jgi:Transcriptional activator of glycolytic enzymes/Centromere DNA-binding protein complex CBF3 subunit, domain 2
MTGCYLTGLPFEFMRGQADFEPAYASSYFLARDVQPPECLRRLVWPDLDRWRAAHLELPEATEKVEPNLAGGAFLELLDRLRDVLLQVSSHPLFSSLLHFYYLFHDPIRKDFGLTFIFLYLQDAALLRREFPQHDLFGDPIFKTPEYIQFEEAVTTAVGTAKEEDPQLVVIQKAIPAVCDRLRTVTGVVKTGLEGNDSSMRRMDSSMQQMERRIDSSMQHMERRMAALESTVNSFCSGTFTFTPGSRRAQDPQPLCSPPLRLPTASPSSGPMPAPTAIESLAEQPPKYSLSRNIATIPDLWREWTVGLGEQLSVEALDERWGSRWRSGAEFQFYSRRKVIITEIKRLVAGGREAREVVNSLEEQRLRAGASLSKVINALKAAKAGTGENL